MKFCLQGACHLRGWGGGGARFGGRQGGREQSGCGLFSVSAFLLEKFSKV